MRDESVARPDVSIEGKDLLSGLSEGRLVVAAVISDRAKYGPIIEAALAALGARLEQLADPDASAKFTALREPLVKYLANLAEDAASLAAEPLFAARNAGPSGA